MIELTGKIEFEPQHITNKHLAQGAWKRTALVLFDGDVTEYYAWFIKKRFGISLNRPARGGHISFINDRLDDIEGKTYEQKNSIWKETKKIWDNAEVDICLDPDVRTNGQHWWFNVPEVDRKVLQYVRKKLGLGRPYFGMHMTLGVANSKNIDLSHQIHGYIKDGLTW